MYSVTYLISILSTAILAVGMGTILILHILPSIPMILANPYMKHVAYTVVSIMLTLIEYTGIITSCYMVTLFSLLGCFGFLDCMIIWGKMLYPNSKKKVDNFVYGNCIVFWTLAAYHLHSQTIGVLAVGSSFGLLRFTTMNVLKERTVLQNMNKSLYLIGFYVWAALYGVINSPLIRPFKLGVLGFGAISYFVCCLMISSKTYDHKSIYTALLCNLVTICSAIVSLVLGSTFSALSPLTGIGGTFLWLLVLERYKEIPWKSGYWAFRVSGLGIILYGLSVFFTLYPDWLISYEALK